MDLRQQQHQRDEESVDQEREASHPLHAQAMSNGYKVSIVTLLSCLVLNDMSQFQRLASLHDRLTAARTRFQTRGGQPRQEREPEPEAIQMDIAVEVQAQAIGAAEAQAQATGAAEAQAQAIGSAAEAPPEGIEGDQRDMQASPFSPLCRWP